MKAYIHFFILLGVLSLFHFRTYGTSQALYSHHWHGEVPFYTNDSKRSYKILIHHSFIVRMNLKTHLVDWLAYELNPNLVWGLLKGKREFKTDPFLSKTGISFEDYKGASQYNYDKGHLAPLGSFKGSSFSYELQYFSNIVPQKKKLNQKLLRYVEGLTRKFVRTGKAVKVLKGPLYADSENAIKPYRTPPAPWNVKKLKLIPSGFWQIVSYVEERKLKVCSLIFPQEGLVKKSLKKYKVNLKDISKYTGLVVFKNSKLKISEGCDFLTKIK